MTQHDPVGDQFKHDPFEQVDGRFGRMERWRRDAMEIGEMGALAHARALALAVVRNDEAGASQAEREESFRQLCDMVAGQHNRSMALMDEVLELRHHNDALKTELSHYRKYDAEPLTEPPGTSGPSVDVLEDDDVHQPGGELHSIEPSEPEDREREQLPEPPEADAAPGDPSGEPEPLGGTEFPQPPSIEEPPLVSQDRKPRRGRQQPGFPAQRAPVAVE